MSEAIETSKEQLRKLYDKALKEVGETNAAIFEVHEMILDDDYLDAIHNMIRTQLVNAEYAVANDLSPSETVQMDKSKILAFVTVHGSTNSHTAILARRMNIPALGYRAIRICLTQMDIFKTQLRPWRSKSDSACVK